MSSFDPAVKHVIKWEDSHPVSGKITIDAGGRTRFGIAERYNQMPYEFWTAPAEQAIQMAADGSRSQAQPGAQGSRADRAVLQDQPGDPGPGAALSPDLPGNRRDPIRRAHAFHNISVA